MTYAVLVANLYIMEYWLDIEKQYWERYQIVQAKLHQHKHYGIDEMGKHKICKYEKGKNRTNKY